LVELKEKKGQSDKARPSGKTGCDEKGKGKSKAHLNTRKIRRYNKIDVHKKKCPEHCK
jgi:hypothetical protein